MLVSWNYESRSNVYSKRGGKGLRKRILTGVLLIGLAVAAAVGYKFYLHRYHFIAKPKETVALRKYYQDLVLAEPTAANYLKLGDLSMQSLDHDEARIAYQKASSIYYQKGYDSFGYVAEMKSQRCEVSVIPYYEVPADKEELSKFFTGAKLEPYFGCFVGAFIDHEDSIKGTYRDEYGNWRRDASAFNHLTNIHHAIFFMYQGYGKEFPHRFVKHMFDNHAAAQIAWEPTDLNQVQDNEYLRTFARAAMNSRTPIFLRFASEMNGDWVPYHGDPKLYIEKFRLVARVMHEEAPNVAMVWCPFETPISEIPRYYPGDEYVDWVGVNIYSVPFWNNRTDTPGDWRNPADSLRFIYNNYAARHPIMICEYAASHKSSLDMKEIPNFARDKIGQFYSALPRLYPRVKAVCWLSMNAIKHAIPGRQSNDYSLLGNPEVCDRYQELIRWEPYYLREVQRSGRSMAKQHPVALSDQAKLKKRVAFSAWVKTYVERPTVVWKANGDETYRSDKPGPYRWVLDTRTLPNGTATIEIDVLNADGQRIQTQTRVVQIEN